MSLQALCQSSRDSHCKLQCFLTLGPAKLSPSVLGPEVASAQLTQERPERRKMAFHGSGIGCGQ